MNPSQMANPFKDLMEVAIHPLLACNLACPYCYQDAQRIEGERVSARAGREWAHEVVQILGRSQRPEIDLIVTGGEPLLLGYQWFREFFEETRTALEGQGKQVTFIIQTNASLALPREMLALCKEHGVRFSVHYDGLLPGDGLQSRRRREVIRRLGAEGFPLSAIVVGTPEALEVLPQTLDFFQESGVAHFHLNPVVGEGRGGLADLNPPPRKRAEAEFQIGFYAWQHRFLPHDSSILWKFVHFCRAQFKPKPPPSTIKPLDCGGGRNSITIYPDGAIYSCGLYCDLTGPSF